MTQQINNQLFAYAKQFADNAFKAQAMALKGMEQVAGLQLGAFERQSQAAVEFFTAASETRDAEGVRALWEKSMTLGRQNAEHTAAVTQEVVAVNQKIGESLAALAQEQRAANEAIVPPVAAQFKTAK